VYAKGIVLGTQLLMTFGLYSYGYVRSDSSCTSM